MAGGAAAAPQVADSVGASVVAVVDVSPAVDVEVAGTVVGSGVDTLAVANVDEGARLRAAGVETAAQDDIVFGMVVQAEAAFAKSQ